MATMANWNGHTFEVSAKLIRGFTDLSVKGSCETTTKNTDKQKYVEHKYGEIPEISLVVSLNAQTGVTDVYGEAMEFVKEATDGECAYFYLGSAKLLPAQMMLTSAEVTEVVFMPGKGDTWISCNVKLTFKQGSKSDGAKASSGGGGKKQQSWLSKTVTTAVTDFNNKVTEKLNQVKNLINNAKNSTQKNGELQYQESLVVKVTKDTKDSAGKKDATTGRATQTVNPKITRVGVTAMKG